MWHCFSNNSARCNLWHLLLIIIRFSRSWVNCVCGVVWCGGWCSEVGYGRSSTEPIRGGQLPKVLTTEPWDGKDGEVWEYCLQIFAVDDVRNTFCLCIVGVMWIKTIVGWWLSAAVGDARETTFLFHCSQVYCSSSLLILGEWNEYDFLGWVIIINHYGGYRWACPGGLVG